jgi:hypothetical protein
MNLPIHEFDVATRLREAMCFSEHSYTRPSSIHPHFPHRRNQSPSCPSTSHSFYDIKVQQSAMTSDSKAPEDIGAAMKAASRPGEKAPPNFS